MGQQLYTVRALKRCKKLVSCLVLGQFQPGCLFVLVVYETQSCIPRLFLHVVEGFFMFFKGLCLCSNCGWIIALVSTILPKPGNRKQTYN